MESRYAGWGEIRRSAPILDDIVESIPLKVHALKVRLVLSGFPSPVDIKTSQEFLRVCRRKKAHPLEISLSYDDREERFMPAGQVTYVLPMVRGFGAQDVRHLVKAGRMYGVNVAAESSEGADRFRE